MNKMITQACGKVGKLRFSSVVLFLNIMLVSSFVSAADLRSIDYSSLQRNKVQIMLNQTPNNI